MAYEFAIIEKKEHLWIITLNRPERMNALHSPAHKELDEILHELKLRLDLVIEIVVNDEVLINRIENRAKESKNARSDDNEEVLKNRLNIYHESTEMIKPYYLEQKKLVKIDGMRSIGQVSSDIEGQLINIEK